MASATAQSPSEADPSQTHALRSFSDVVQRLVSLASSRPRDAKVTVDDIHHGFGDRSVAPLLLVPALLGASPVAGVPSVPTLLASLIAIIAVQAAAGRHRFWLPGLIAHRSVKAGRLEGAACKTMRFSRWLDKLFKARLRGLTGRTADRLVCVLVVLLCVMVPPLEFLPFVAIVPSLAIALLATALLTRDGVAVLLGGALSIGTLVAFVDAVRFLIGEI